MLVFSTKLPLRREVTPDQCLNVFIDWIAYSPHYNIDSMEYAVESHEDFDFTNENITISFRYYKDERVELSACRLENREQIAVWRNDCIFINENGKKFLFVQLNCNRRNYGTTLPHVHKPYVVRKVVESGFCSKDDGLPIVDKPLVVEDGYYDSCVRIMKGEYPCLMPSVYISCDYWGDTAISPDYLARQLSGIAHVFVEKNHETSLKLRDDTNGNNAHNGYVGVYFPNTAFCQKHSLAYYHDYKELTQEIISSVWKALINRLDSSIYNWNQIITLQSRQKMAKWRDISEQDKAQLNEYMCAFDSENESLRNQVAELNRQMYALRSQLDSLKASVDSGGADQLFYKMGDEPSLYNGERNDLLYSVLSQVQDRFDTNSRGFAIIRALLAANPKSGECKRTVDIVREVFSGGGQLSKAGKAKLKDVGFTITEDGPHYKLVFRDPRYMFTVSKTPSDHREGKNLISDICKIIDVNRKLGL